MRTARRHREPALKVLAREVAGPAVVRARLPRVTPSRGVATDLDTGGRTAAADVVPAAGVRVPAGTPPFFVGGDDGPAPRAAHGPLARPRRPFPAAPAKPCLAFAHAPALPKALLPNVVGVGPEPRLAPKPVPMRKPAPPDPLAATTATGQISVKLRDRTAAAARGRTAKGAVGTLLLRPARVPPPEPAQPHPRGGAPAAGRLKA